MSEHKEVYSVIIGKSIHLERAMYVFDFIQNYPLSKNVVSFNFNNKESGTNVLVYGERIIGNNKEVYFIPCQKVMFKAGKYPENIISNPYSYKGQKLWSVEKKKHASQEFFTNGSFAFDIIETIFFHISRIEEYKCSENQKDEHDRMLSEHQFLVKNGIQHIPVVDHLVYCFLDAIGAAPVRFKTSNRVTTDVDLIRKFLFVPPFRSTFKYVFSQPNLKSLRKLWGSYFMTKSGFRKDPYLIFDWLFSTGLEIERTAYFLTNGTSKYDKPYPKIDKEFYEVFKNAKDNDWEIGIHPSYETVNDMDLMKEEKNRLEGITGERIGKSRQHFLHFSFPETADILEQAGIQEDSSLGYSDRIGFRCGTGFPYRLYNFEEERPYRFLEIPLIVMDVALLREAQREKVDIFKIWNGFMSFNHENTFITFNFHNSTFFDAELDGYDLEKLYIEVIEWAKIR